MKKKDAFLSLIKGFITGIFSLIPGISPASVIFSLNSYEDFIISFGSIKANKKALSLVGIPLLIGIIIGIYSGISFTEIISVKYKFHTIMLYIGLIIGSLKISINKEKIKLNIKNIFIFLISILISLLFYFFFKSDLVIYSNKIINTISIAILSAVSFIVPSISYFSLNLLKSINSFWYILLFVLVIVSILSNITIFFNKLLKKNRKFVYIVIYGLLISSIIISILHIDSIVISFTYIFTGILAFMWGYILSLNIVNE